ncbi:MAG: hypothetical protein Q7V88_14740 [Actinomycetota bacterium]|nr:hypothetical protein [Actinomycetota bacterium]
MPAPTPPPAQSSTSPSAHGRSRRYGPSPIGPSPSDQRLAEGLPRPSPVRCGIDALRVLFLTISQPLQPETLAFMLDRHGNGGLITVVSGTVEPDAVLSVAECLSRAASGAPQASALVLASVRPHGCVLPGDLDRWLDASASAAEHGIDLLEWYIIGPSGAQCPRDLLGEPERWSRLSPAV